MHELGELKYGVELEDFRLTVETLDQGFDLRKTIEDLYAFCEKYSYSIIKQVGTNTYVMDGGHFSNHSSYELFSSCKNLKNSLFFPNVLNRGLRY